MARLTTGSVMYLARYSPQPARSAVVLHFKGLGYGPLLTHMGTAGPGHGAVSGEVDGGSRLPSDLNGAGLSYCGEPSQGKR